MVRRFLFLILVVFLGLQVWIWLGGGIGSPEFVPAPETEVKLTRAAEDRLLDSAATRVDAAGRELREVAQTAPSAASTAPLLDRVARLAGTISFVESGTPAADYELCAFGEGMDDVRVRTDVRGAYSMALSPGVRFVGSSSADRHAWCTRLDLAPGEERQLDRALGDTTDLCLRVWSRSPSAIDGRLPLSGAQVALLQVDGDALVGQDPFQHLGAVDAWTDRDGRAAVRMTDFAAYLVRVRGPGHLETWIELDFRPDLSQSPFDEDGCVSVVLEPQGGVIHGRVLDADGQPIEGAIVFVAAREDDPTRADPRVRFAQGQPHRRPDFVRSNARGNFAAPAPRGVQRELVVLPRRADLQHHFVQPLEPGDPGVSAPILLRLPRAHRIELELVDSSGAPIPGSASLQDPDGRPHAPSGPLDDAEMRAGERRRFFPLTDGRLTLLHPGGAVELALSPNGTWRDGTQLIRLPVTATTSPLRVVVP